MLASRLADPKQLPRRLREDQIVRDLGVLTTPGIEFIQAEVVKIDVAGRRVETTGRPVDYDYLILALGAEYASESVPGLDPAAHTYYTLSGAAALQPALRGFPEGGGRVAIAVCGMSYKCPAAPYEGAMLIADYFRHRGLGRRVEVHVYTPEPQPMPVPRWAKRSRRCCEVVRRTVIPACGTAPIRAGGYVALREERDPNRRS